MLQYITLINAIVLYFTLHVAELVATGSSYKDILLVGERLITAIIRKK